MKKTFSSKRGQTFLDVLVIAVILVVTAIAYVIIAMLQSSITEQMLSDDTLSDVSQTSLKNFDSSHISNLDNTFLIVFILFWIFVVVSSLFVDANPIFFVISIILLVVVLVIGAIMGNVYSTFAMENDIYTFSSAFSKMGYIMDHLLTFIVFIAVTALIAMYGKNTFARGGGI